jgi:hypothetical protein
MRSKAALLALLRSKPTERPRIGSFARPRVARGTQMPSDCLWATCNGLLTAHGHTHYLCSNCETWFELLPSEDVDSASEWMM